MPSFKSLSAGITGTDAYTAQAEEIRAKMEASIPDALRLPKELLEDLPADVSGVPASCGLLSSGELAITELDATSVRDRIAEGSLSAVEAVTAFGKRAAIVHQVTACLTEWFLDEGIQRAMELDEHFARTGQVVGPLHGVPISVKEHMPIAGHHASCGFLSTYCYTEEDSSLVALLRKLGAVFYVKTNQPQGIMHLESHGFMARTLNPFNTRLSSGGSSGGEGALVGGKGSCLGLGTDIGGSIRAPCAHNGM
jgi:amidase